LSSFSFVALYDFKGFLSKVKGYNVAYSLTLGRSNAEAR